MWTAATLLITSAIIQEIGAACLVLPTCRAFTMTAVKYYGPDRPTPGLISFDGTPAGSASLNSRAFTFAVPEFLNITVGNSGDQLAQLELRLVSSPGGQKAVVCTYQGIGVYNPWSVEEQDAANAYRFRSCDDLTTGVPAIGVGSIVSVDQIKTAIVDGGNTGLGDIVGIMVVLYEVPLASSCFVQEPQSMQLVAGDDQTSAKIYAGQFATAAVTTNCVQSSSFVPSSSRAPSLPSSSLVPALSSADVIVSVPQSLAVDNGSPLTDVSTTANSAFDGASIDSSTRGSWKPSAIVMYIGAGGVGLLILIILLIICICCIRRRRKRASDLEKAKKTHGLSDDSFFGSSDTVMPPNYRLSVADFDRVYGFYEEQEQFGQSSDYDLQADTHSKNLGGGEGADHTLMNTKAVIALPGFLKMDYQADLRPEQVLAEGGGGVIYLAELLDERVKEKHRVKRVAVKLVKNPANWKHDELLTNFRQEVSIMWSLNFNDNIIKLIGYTEEPMAIIMKHYSQSLGDLIKNSQFHELLDVETTLRFSYHIVNAMTEMHSLNIVHRDLKTVNLLIDAPAGSATEPWMWK
eukprot:Partr_v1_DN27840_c0_g1_i1_m23335